MTQDISPGARRYRDAIKAITSLAGAGFPSRLAGGCVRDRLLGDVPFDYDVATVAKPDEVMRHFKAVGWRTVPTGLDHGTVTLVMPSGPVEITTLRVDVATDGRHAQVAFGTSFEEDAARRDFTINAMFEDADGVIYDYHHGKEDLSGHMLRFVGDATSRIKEDYLRILRLFRFQSKLGFDAAPGTMAAITAERNGLARISQERITAELQRTFVGAYAGAAMVGVQESGVLSQVLPEIRNVPVQSASFWIDLRAAPEVRRPVATLAALGLKFAVANEGTTKEGFTRLGERLKLKTTDTRALAFVSVAREMLRQPHRDVADRLAFVDACDAHAGANAISELLVPVYKAIDDRSSLTILSEIARDEERYGHLRVAKLPLDGTRVMRELGITAGPALGETMETLRRAYRNGAWQTADEGLQWLRDKASKTAPTDL